MCKKNVDYFVFYLKNEQNGINKCKYADKCTFSFELDAPW